MGLGQLEAIVLAAGAGSRFGGGKLTAPFGGGRLIDAAVATALAAPVRSVIVVTGADPVVAEALADRRVRLIEAADHALGLAHSLRAGLDALPADTAGVYVFLGDMPRVPTAILAKLAQALDDGAWAAAPVHAGRRGHPVLFATELFSVLTMLTGDQGARALLDGLGARLVLVETDDPGVLTDVDTPDDLTNLRHISRSGIS